MKKFNFKNIKLKNFKLKKPSFETIRDLLYSWLPIAAAITLVLGVNYWTTQQNYRLTANDPQTQIIQDLTDRLNTGEEVDNIIGDQQTSLVNSLSVFAIIYDDKGNVVKSTVSNEGKTPVLPSGVFETLRKKGTSSFTWEPQKGVRIAAVASQLNNNKGFVLAGKSLSEVEKRETRLMKQTLVGWIVSLAATLALIIILRYLKYRKL